MSFFTCPAIPLDTSPSVKQQLGYAIAKYALFPFLNSQRSQSDLFPFVKSSLPQAIVNSVNQVQSKKNKRAGVAIRQAIPFLGGLFGTAANGFGSAVKPVASAVQPVANVFEGGINAFGDLLLQGLKQGTLAGSNYLQSDSAWNTTTISTNSIGGDQAWSTIISVGESGQRMRVNIDSGSADMFLFEPTCAACSLQNHSAYDYSQSSSFMSVPQSNFSSSYADGSSVRGYLARDTVNLGNMVQVQNQLFGMATDISKDWSALAIDGLMGIGPDSLSSFNVSGNQGVFSRLVSNKMLADPVIGIALVKETQESVDGEGEFSFGKIDTKWIRGGLETSLVWTTVSSHNFWGIDLSGIYMNGANIMSSRDPPRAIIDTGTSLTLVSTNVAANVHRKIPGAVMDSSNGIWRVPCSVGSAAVSAGSQSIFFQFEAGGEKFGIPLSDLAYQKASEGGSQQMCYSGIQSGGDNFVILGDVFIKNNYVVLKYASSAQKTIGFGQRADQPPLI